MVEQRYIQLNELSTIDQDEYEIWDEIKQEWVDINKSCYVESGDFPDIEKADKEINVITIYDTIDKMYYTWGLGAYTPKQDNVIYVHCDTEIDLLQNFLHFYEKQYPDIISGWNSEYFDIPYIVNRITNILGDIEVKRLSPVKDEVAFPMRVRDFRNNFGNIQRKYSFEGVSLIDYLEAYKKFSMGDRDSYSLDSIAELEGVGNKIPHEENLAELSVKNWEKFIDYNIHDVTLLVKLNEKLKFIELLRMLAYTGLTPFEAALGTVSVVNGRCIVEGHRMDPPRIIPTFVRDTKNPVKFEGGYVADPVQGFADNIVSFDANSLYPCCMMTMNLSPETKLGKVMSIQGNFVYIKTVNNKDIKIEKDKFERWLKTEKVAISEANILFSQKKKGLFPSIIESIYATRREKKDLWSDKRIEYSKTKNPKLLPEIDSLWLFQYTLKILLNSFYGYTANNHSAMQDIDIARSVTLTGQNVIKESSNIIRRYTRNITKTSSDPILYNDTDSAYCTITPILQHLRQDLCKEGNVSPEAYRVVCELEEYLNKEIDRWAREKLHSIEPKFVFKRESICDVGLFLQKKRYILHKLDDEGVPCNKFKYTGVEVVRTTMPKNIKPLAKQIIETMVLTKSKTETNKIIKQAYDLMLSMPPEQIAIVSKLSNYDKYQDKADGLKIGLRTPIHAKASIFYNYFLKEFKLTSQYSSITNGDKVRFYYTKKNKYGVNVIAFKTELPDKIKETFQVDYNRMFDKILYSIIDRYYNIVGWPPYNPNEEVQMDLTEFFGI